MLKYKITIDEDGGVSIKDAQGKPVRDAKWLIEALGEIGEEKHQHGHLTGNTEKVEVQQ